MRFNKTISSIKSILVILLLFVVLNSFGQQSDTIFFKEYNLKAVGKYKNGLYNGKWTYFFLNGIKQSEGIYSNGQLTGKWTNWYPNGALEHEKIFDNGKLIKVVKICDTTGVELGCDIYFLIAMDYFDKRQSKESDLHFDKAIELCPDSTMYLVLSSINKNFLEDDSTAIINLTNYLNRNPNNTDVLTTRAESYLLEEKYEDCLKDVNKSIELGSTREKNFMIKGDALESLGRYENAIEAYDKYISTFPKEDNSKDKTEAIKRRDICKEKVKHKKN